MGERDAKNPKAPTGKTAQWGKKKLQNEYKNNKNK